jgi:hypothetical protein
MRIFPEKDLAIKQALRVILSYFSHPARRPMVMLSRIIKNQRDLFKMQSAIGQGVWRQLIAIHHALNPANKADVPLALEVCRFMTGKSFRFGHPIQSMPSVQSLLEQTANLQTERDGLVRQLFLESLYTVAHRAHRTDEKSSSSAVTQISALLHNLRSSENLDVSSGTWRELQSKLVDVFPIWICRKQAVSFLFPCRERMFDLVVVDEATQCRVDDALPLIYRADKIMVVGDDKQTVLAKDSVIDDYLFAEFNLDEHLRATQARGIKGGGSHIFGLVKGIKQAAVMLDEHYRCPPDIISYSNKYVYNDELRTMQWVASGRPSTMIINYDEKSMPLSERPESGAFKAIEIDMVDRWFQHIEKSIVQIEKETGKRINLETDVALCYFLLKNEPYVKHRKAEWLQHMDRGADVLDGAGAALQGKERPYIFYLWDIARSNMMAFKQGDDPDKRRGELNVLMSRPKYRAYHYLHKNFDELDHDKATIARFLWNAWQAQQAGAAKEQWTPRQTKPAATFIPWRRSSGQLIKSIVSAVDQTSDKSIWSHKRGQFSVKVGDPAQKIDFVVPNGHNYVGIVDLCGFDYHEQTAQDVMDYFFQVKRATPGIEPVFAFLHELADQQSQAFMSLRKVIKAKK